MKQANEEAKAKARELRERLRDSKFELYSSMEGVDAVVGAIDTAIDACVAETLRKIAAGAWVADALQEAMRTIVKPVMAKNSKFGACDTEPEWHVCDALVAEIYAATGVKLEANWELRGWL